MIDQIMKHAESFGVSGKKAMFALFGMFDGPASRRAASQG